MTGLLTGVALTACNPVAPTARDIGGELGVARDVSTQGDNCWADFNGDGRDDVVLLNHGHSDGAQLFTDSGSGRFVLRFSFKRVSGAGQSWDWHSCAPGDFNGDGRLDVYMGAGGCEGRCSSYPKSLYLQNSNGTFTDVAQTWGVTDPTGRGRDSHAFDVNGDGRLDLYIANETPVNHPSYNRLYVNQGSSFRDATAEYGLPTTSPVAPLGVIQGLAVDSSDFDGDGFEDLAVCGHTRFLLYRSLGARLLDVAGASGLSGRPCNDARFVDVNSDGRPDLVITAYQRLWVRLQTSAGTFPVDNYSIALSAGYDSGVGDADGDGDADIYVVNGKPGSAANAPDKLLLNAGSGTSYSDMAGLPHTGQGDGDSAEIQPNWRGRGGSLIIVNNGRWGSGPRQAIEIVGTPPEPPARPDLVVDSLEWEPSTVSTGDPVTFRAVVRNAGSVATPSGVIHGVGFRVDGRTVTWSDTSVASLEPGASVTLTANSGAGGAATWSAETGTHTIEAYVDDVDRIVETNEQNNRRSTPMEVMTPPGAGPT